MTNNDTIELLKECDQGVKMGISAIDDVFQKTDDENLRGVLNDYRQKHERLQDDLVVILHEHGCQGEEPNMMAKGMSYLKTNFKMMMEDSDKTVADLMTDGCDMGIKSLTRYLNEYAAADNEAKAITKDIVKVEEDFKEDLKKYL